MEQKCSAEECEITKKVLQKQGNCVAANRKPEKAPEAAAMAKRHLQA